MNGQATLVKTAPITPHLQGAIIPCIHEIFEAQAAKNPAAIAVTCGSETLTYAELDKASNRLANHLVQQGISLESRVALLLERSSEMVIAILAVLKAGAAYVPIDLSYPSDRASFMVQDASAALVITQEKFRTRFRDESTRIIAVDSDSNQIRACTDDRPSAQVSSDNLAYVIYTSGSTGKPKGVLVTHRNVVRLLKETEHWYRFTSSDVWPLFHSYAFDVSVWELWGSLFYGGRLVIVPYLITRSPSDFYRLLSDQKVTVLNQTPSAFRQLIWAEQAAAEKLPLSLRYVICAGEALELQSLRPWFDLHGDQKPRVVNMYGITETTVHSTYRVIRKQDLDSGCGSVVGVPIPDLQIYLVDEDLKLVPRGVPGEICVGGDGVARGYLNRPELTAKRFVPDPFSNDPAARLYRSGDLAQYNEQGELEYLGRMDFQVKIRGFRVELGEIESRLNSHPGIRESVVIAREASNGDKRLIAYAVPDGAPPAVTDLRDYLGLRLPDYMVPSSFIFLSAFPLNNNGKIDRKALPAPDGSRPDLKSAYVAPRTAEEAALAAIWTEILEVRQVGVRDNFFELGGDSIRSISILSRAEKCGVHISLEQLFSNPTIEALAAVAASASVPQQESQAEPFELISAEDRALLPATSVDAYPIGKLQLGMFFRNELSPQSAIYHDVFSYRLRCAFDPKLFERALTDLLERHPVLRTSFHLAGYSEPLQIVHREASLHLTWQDLRSMAGSTQEQRIAEWVAREKRNPFDRTTAPLVRFHVQLLSDDEFQFFFSFHHCCLDGWSLAAAVTEVFEEYSALLAGTETRIATPGAQYREFIRLERQIMGDSEARNFWKSKVAESVPAQVPRWPRSLLSGGLEQRRGPEVAISPQVLSGLRQLARNTGVPLKSVLLAAHTKVMSFVYGQTDVVTGLISNGRPEIDQGERTVGLFLNAVPFRLQLKNETWAELVAESFRQEQMVLPYRRMPLAEIQKLCGGKQLFETAFDFVHFHVYRNLRGRQEIDLSEGHYFEANDMALYTTFMLDVSSTSLELHIDYDPNRVAEEQAAQITEYYVRVLQSMAADPDGKHIHVSLLSGLEINRLSEWNKTEERYPASGIHTLFEAVASKIPGAVALRFREREVTYLELNEAANNIAASLRMAGAAKGQVIGICSERSPLMVAGLLGILKTGAAYLPLDPAYPATRLSFMIEDSKTPLILASRSAAGTLPTGRTIVTTLGLEDAAASSHTTQKQESTPTGPSDLAYVIYTSGSTGKPKGVQVTHSGVVNLLCSAGKKLGVEPQDRLLAVTTLSFDIAALELFMPLLHGASVTIATRECAADARDLSELIQSSKATIMQATPATWRLLLVSGWSGKPDLRIICGGEALKQDLANELVDKVAALWNFYGPTETTIWSSAALITKGESVTIGRPLANTQLYVLSPSLQPVPVGCIGEIWIGGAGVSPGYLNRPELTAEKFVSNPAFASGRMFKTGDLGRFLPDGRLECLGRVDHQVKIRGYRIEPGEVEAALKQTPGVTQAVVVAREDSTGEKRLIAYICCTEAIHDTAAIRGTLLQSLPAHMVPASFIQVREIPLTPNGKVDVAALPGAGELRPISRPYAPPRNAREQAIADTWKDVLAISAVGINDNFFEIGGDSLSATRAFARINRLFQADLSLQELLQHSTIAELAKLVELHQGRASLGRLVRQPRKSDTLNSGI